MKLFRFVLASLLALCLVLMPVVSSANAGSTTAPTPTKTLPTGFKFPPISEIAKRLASRANVVNYAVESLLGAVDWVLDPANNQIRYKPVSVAQDVSTSSMNPNDYVYPVHHTEFKVDIMYTTPVQACVHHIWNTYHNAKHVYTGYEFSQSGLLSCQFKNVIDDYESSIGWFPTLDREKDKEYTLPLDVVAEQIIKNAKAGHVESVDVILAMSAAKADSDTADSDKDEAEEKPKTDKPIKTGNPDIDDIFKNAYPKSDGEKDYQYPGTREELERDLKNANPEKYEEEIRDDGSKVTKTKFSDGFRVNIYPGRKSKDFKETGWEIRKPNGNDIYKGTTK